MDPLTSSKPVPAATPAPAVSAGKPDFEDLSDEIQELVRRHINVSSEVARKAAEAAVKRWKANISTINEASSSKRMELVRNITAQTANDLAQRTMQLHREQQKTLELILDSVFMFGLKVLK